VSTDAAPAVYRLRAEPAGSLQAELREVDSDHPSRSFGAQRLHDLRSDRAEPQHDRRRARNRSGELDRVHRHGERLGQRTGIVADIAAEGEDVLARDGVRDPDQLRERSRSSVGDALGPGLGAQVEAALLAAEALVARHQGRRGHPVADGDAVDIRPGLDHFTDEFVAHHLTRLHERAV
jgi:hypothetical protein